MAAKLSASSRSSGSSSVQHRRSNSRSSEPLEVYRFEATFPAYVLLRNDTWPSTRIEWCRVARIQSNGLCASGSPCICSGSLVPPSPSCPRCHLSAAKIVRAFFKIQNGVSSLFLQSAATASAAENDFVSLRHLLYSIYYVYYIDRPSLFSPSLDREQDLNVCFGPRYFRASS